MPTLQFKSFSFASLPSGTYLFFPARQSEATSGAGRARDVAEHAPRPERVVVSTPSGGEPRAAGFAAGETLYLSLDAPEFDELLNSLSAERNFNRRPVSFEFDLDDEDTVARLAIDDRALPFSEVRRSGIPPINERRTG